MLDLGSGSGKACYIISQIVGAKGKVIGVDFNPPMLELARKYQQSIGDQLGYHNVEFRRGKIQDLKTNLELLDQHLQDNPVRSVADLARLEEFKTRIRRERPLIADESIDVIVSNCVLNLVRPEDKRNLFAEMYRVLKRGGRVAISDIVSDEPVPEHLAQDPNLWSACVSGAFQEEELLRAFEEAKFHGIQIEDFSSVPYQTVEGIEFRAVTVTAYKGKEGPCIERNQAVIYRGPWKQVMDDDGHTLERGARMAVCEKTFGIYSKAPYKDQFILVPPREEIPRGADRRVRLLERPQALAAGDQRIGFQSHANIQRGLRAEFEVVVRRTRRQRASNRNQKPSPCNRFVERLQIAGDDFRRRAVDVLQVNLGRYCNLACIHCHVESGPTRKEMMSRENVDAVLRFLARTDIPTLDITGGAPELHPISPIWSPRRASSDVTSWIAAI